MTKFLNDSMETAQDAPNPTPKVTDGTNGGLSHADIIRSLMKGTKDHPAPPQSSIMPTPPKITPQKAASTAFCRAAEQLYSLPAFPKSVEFEIISLAELAELIPEQALLAVIEAPDEEIGVVALCPVMAGSLIEMQTVGRISAHPVRPRKPTRTDAVITADFVPALLRELGKELAARKDLPRFASFSYASFVDSPRPMLLMLEDRPLSFLSMRFHLGTNAQREGQAIIALPIGPDCQQDDPQKTLPRQIDDATKTPSNDAIPMPQAGPAQDAPRAKTTLQRPVSLAQIKLVGVLGRKMLSLAALKRLSPGDLIPLPSGALDQARIETVSGQLLAMGRLGEADSYHAIRLRAPLHEPSEALPDSQPKDDVSAPSGLDTAPRSPGDIDLSQPDAFRTEYPSESLSETGHANEALIAMTSSAQVLEN